MHKVRLNLKKRSYDIIIGSNIAMKLGAIVRKLGLGTDVYIITNPFLKSKFGKKIAGSFSSAGIKVKFKTVADTEKSKSVETAAGVLKDLSAYDVRKRVFIAALGGGVVGDLAGFVASIYKRGIPYIQIPTTLLAQVDSAIGGKTAVDLKEGKNLIGAIYQPRLVFSDVAFLKSLNKRQLAAGLAEVIKYGAIKDAALFSFLERNRAKILKGDLKSLEHIVERCSAIKAGIVSRDEKEEKGLRTVLNFGHTAGHAIEAASGYSRLNHGEAIGLGMLVACGISRRLRLTDSRTEERLEDLTGSFGLPSRIKGLNFGKIISAHYHDKKFLGAKNRFVLIAAIGKIRIVKNIPLQVIKDSIRERF